MGKNIDKEKEDGCHCQSTYPLVSVLEYSGILRNAIWILIPLKHKLKVTYGARKEGWVQIWGMWMEALELFLCDNDNNQWKDVGGSDKFWNYVRLW